MTDIKYHRFLTDYYEHSRFMVFTLTNQMPNIYSLIRHLSYYNANSALDTIYKSDTKYITYIVQGVKSVRAFLILGK